MIDIEILKFYNEVKDPTWPDIQSYNDYLALPNKILKECNNIHNFQQRRKEICDLDHWIMQSIHVCTFENLAFVPIGKCAYVYNTTMFNKLGWKRTPLSQLDLESTVFFGTIMNPLMRHLKAMTEWLIVSYQKTSVAVSKTNPWVFEFRDTDWPQLNEDIEKKYFKNLIGSALIGDPHSIPYYLTLGSLMYRINWIPMDVMSDNDVKISMMNLFKLYNHDIQLPLNDQRLHVSSPNKLRIFEIVKEQFFSDPQNHFNFYNMHTKDLDLYYNLLENFSPDWQHIKK